jgi:hypothetical protein
VLAFAAIGLLASGCGLLDSGPKVHVENLTNTRMEAFVNGASAGSFGPGTSGDVSLGSHGKPPYRVSIQSPSGNSLMDITVTPEDIQRVAEGGHTGGGTTGIPCGEIRVSMGRTDAAAPGPAGVDQMPACP